MCWRGVQEGRPSSKREAKGRKSVYEDEKAMVCYKEYTRPLSLITY